MAEPKPQPYSDSQIEIICSILSPMPTIDYRRFLDTIAEYKKALDSAMRQVSSLNRGNIADRKRIADQTATIKRLRGALEFYADERNYYFRGKAYQDMGELARQVIGKEE